jgi:hypothetical protein
MAGAEDVEAEKFFFDGVDALETEVAKLDLEIAGVHVEEHSAATCLEGHWLRCGPFVDHSHGHQSNPGVAKGGGCKRMMDLAKDRRWRSAIFVSGNRDDYLECFGGGPSYLRAQIFRPLERAVGG